MKIKSILTSILLTTTCAFTFASDPFDPAICQYCGALYTEQVQPGKPNICHNCTERRTCKICYSFNQQAQLMPGENYICDNCRQRMQF